MGISVQEDAIIPKSTLTGLFFLSTSALAFEINLTRLFSVAQFYHFAFMIVSLALLGYGGSGTFLVIFPRIKEKSLSQTISWISSAQAVTIIVAYLFVNEVPFDSFSIAWNAKQAILLAGHFIAMSLPFFFNGLGIGLLLAVFPEIASRTYTANLLGSAAGCLLALIAPSITGIEGMISLSCALAALSALICFYRLNPAKIPGYTQDSSSSFLAHHPKRGFSQTIAITAIGILLGVACLDLGLRYIGKDSLSWMKLNLSPYKSLSYVMQYPGTEVIFRQSNAFSRVDVVRSVGIRSLPGLSYRCLGEIPDQDGLLVDGDELTPILRRTEKQDFYNCLPGAVAYKLRPEADVLIIEPRGGLDILTALNLGAHQVTAVEANPLVVNAANEIYSLPNVTTVVETERSYFHRTGQSFDIISFPLTNSYHPIRSGAFSLAEDYRYTVESFTNALDRLRVGGLLVITRWLQNPPSEDLKSFALVVTALEQTGGHPEGQIIAFRGYNTLTILASKLPFSSQELNFIRLFSADRAFDLVYAQNLTPEESNVFNIMPEPIYFQTYFDFTTTKPRHNFYITYPFKVTPPTDDQPFMGHYFKWSQVEQIVAELGKTMQPFGGAGYLIIPGLLGLATLLAGIFILLPLGLKRGEKPAPRFRMILYFGMLGLGYLLVEIPLMQHFILFLGQPAYAMTGVLFSLLFFSAIGSQASRKISLIIALPLLITLLVLTPIVLPFLFSKTLVVPFYGRLAVTILSLAPLGFCMGVPFPGGIRWLERWGNETLIPWAWGINGATSVIAAVLAALLAISFGFSWVFRIGALCYGVSLLMVMKDYLRCHSQSPDQ